MAIYVWGTGCGASELIGQGLDISRIEGFVDSFPCGDTFLGKPVLLPEALPIHHCQLLIIAARHADAIAQRCEALGIPKEKCLFLKNSAQLHDRNADCAAAEELLGTELLNRLLPRQHIIPTPAQLANARLPEGELQNDYVRLATLELICRRLDAVDGAAAELGVYRGHFARGIHRLLPERKLYLFDSFAGFAPETGASDAFQSAHANTSVEKVLALMDRPEQVVVKAGYFPGSAQGLEETFCLVSLDVDFEQTTLDGLRYFWPRLAPGGYLMLHDWGNPSLPGVAAALDRYQQEIGARLPGFPLCDVGGSLILAKI